MAADRMVAAEENVSLPLRNEHTLGGATLVAGIFVDGSPPRRGPAPDFYAAAVWVVDQAPVIPSPSSVASTTGILTRASPGGNSGRR
jgi:hypothetical protein